LFIVHICVFRFCRNNPAQKNLFAETCPQYLLLDDSLYNLPGCESLKYIMCPPLRSSTDCNALWQGLNNDIDVIGTDHCSFRFDTQKILGKDDFKKCPNGIPGIEERIPLMYSEGVVKNRMSLRRFTELCSAMPAKIFGLYPQKGVLAAGSDADIVILDPDKKQILNSKNLHSNADYCVYEGREVQGVVNYTISRGEIIVDHGELSGKPGRGKFIKRNRYSMQDKR